jgi:hypothetical protein
VGAERQLSAAAAARLALVAAPWLALAWLWFGRPAPWAAVAAATVAFAGAAHGLGRAIGCALADDDAPAVLAIGWGAAAYALVAGGLARADVEAGAAADAVVLAGLVAGAPWALAHLRARATGVDERPAAEPAAGAWLARLVAAALAALAIAAAAAGGGGAITPTLSPALAALADAAAGAAAHPIAAALVDDGWAFALALALALVVARGGALARVLLVLALASLPIAVVSVRWLAVAWTLTALATLARPLRAGRRWPALAGLAAAIATLLPAEPRATLLGVAVGLAAWALGAALTDAGADDALAGRGRPRGLVATAGALAIVLPIARPPVPVGRPPSSWQDRLERRLDDAAALVRAERATL